MAGSRPGLVVAKGTNVARIAVPDVIMKHDIDTFVCIELPRKAGFT